MPASTDGKTERRREFLHKVGKGAAAAAVVTASLATAKPGRAGIGGGYKEARNRHFREAWKNRYA
jgi:hypothetical protein